MGKSTIAKAFSELGVRVWDADSAVHEIYETDSALKNELKAIFGDILDEFENIDRKKLGQIVLGNDDKLKKLEKIVHPLVKNHREKFIAAAKSENQFYVVLDIPLLFETKSQNNFDKIIVVNCSPETQRKRVLSRPNMSKEKFESILSKQIRAQEKVALADFAINTDKPLDETLHEVQQLHEKLLKLARAN